MVTDAASVSRSEDAAESLRASSHSGAAVALSIVQTM